MGLGGIVPLRPPAAIPAAFPTLWGQGSRDGRSIFSAAMRQERGKLTWSPMLLFPGTIARRVRSRCTSGWRGAMAFACRRCAWLRRPASRRAAARSRPGSGWSSSGAAGRTCSAEAFACLRQRREDVCSGYSSSRLGYCGGASPCCSVICGYSRPRLTPPGMMASSLT
jgi:hypothetical protein